MTKAPMTIFMLLLSLILNSCKAQEIRKSPPYQYYYLDQELPFILWVDPPYGEDVSVWYEWLSDEYNGKYHIPFFFSAKREDDYDPLLDVHFFIDLYDTKELEGYIKEREWQLDFSSACFNEVQYDKKGIKTIPLRLFNAREGTDTASPSLWKTFPAKLYTFSVDASWMGCEKDPCTMKDVYWIILDRLPDLPAGKALRIKLAFPYPSTLDKEQDKKVKKQTAQFLCNTARQFTWADFGERFKPSLWKKIQFSSDLAPAKVYVHREKPPKNLKKK